MDSYLKDSFNKFASAFPGLARKAKPLGAGLTGLVVEWKNGTIGKFYFRPEESNEQQKSWIDAGLAAETFCLKTLKNAHLGDGIRFPALVQKPRRLNNKSDFYAWFSMTKVPGTGQSWDNHVSKKGRLKPGSGILFRQAGRLLAAFHSAMEKKPEAHAFKNKVWKEGGTRIAQVPTLDQDTNTALAAADSYLKKNIKSAFIHGDIHGQNILFDKKNGITSLIDFAFAGQHGNYLVDFRNVPDSALPDFIKGYEDGGGRKTDIDMVKMTEISGLADFINWQSERGLDSSAQIKTLNKRLSEVSRITGFTPPRA